MAGVGTVRGHGRRDKNAPVGKRAEARRREAVLVSPVADGTAVKRCNRSHIRWSRVMRSLRCQSEYAS